MLLLTVQPKIFALPVQKIVPTKIKAQYEHEDDFRASLLTKTARDDNRRQNNSMYQSVTEIY